MSPQPTKHRFKARLGRSFSLFFFLDKKERKNQDVAKLQPREAERWPAATSGHRAFPIDILC
jgi:hypothetical protein